MRRALADGSWRLSARCRENKGVPRQVIVCGWLALCLVPPGFAQQPTRAACSSLAEARSLIERQRWSDAAAFLRTELRADPACEETGYLLGYVLLRANQPDASLKAYTAAAKLRPPTSEEFTGIASDYILLKSYTDAQRWLLRAVQASPVNPQAWYLLGRTQYNLDLDAAAVESFQHGLILLPKDVRTEYNLGLAYERLQQPELAREAYKQAIAWTEQSAQPDAQPYLDLGMLDRSEGHPENALPFLRRAASLSPDNPLVFQELGRALADLHRTDQAIAALKTAIRLAPEAGPPHFLLGRLYRSIGRTTEAEEQFQAVQNLIGSPKSETPNIDHPQ